MIFTESTIKISNNVSKMDSTIVLYRGDKNIEIRFTILQSPFKYSNTVATNVIESTNASYGQLVIKTPNDKPPIFSEVSATKEGTVLFTITKEMIDEIEELGNYTFQIRLLDENKQSRVTIPPVENGIEIKEPIAIEDDNTTNVVGLAKANYAVATLSDVDTPTFDDNGKYNKTNWNDGDIITNTLLNKIEDGIYTTNENVTTTKKYVDDGINYDKKQFNNKIEAMNMSKHPVSCSTEIYKKPLCDIFPELLNITYNTVFRDYNSFKVNMDNFAKEYPTVKSAYNKLNINLYDENDNSIGNSYGNSINGEGLNIIFINITESLRFYAYFDKALVDGSSTTMETKNGYMTIQLLIPKGNNKQEFIDKIKNLKLTLSVFRTDFLNLNNETMYTPTTDYNPATKKYVDDNMTTTINGVKGDLGTEELTTVAKDLKGAVNELNTQYKDIANDVGLNTFDDCIYNRSALKNINNREFFSMVIIGDSIGAGTAATDNYGFTQRFVNTSYYHQGFAKYTMEYFYYKEATGWTKEENGINLQTISSSNASKEFFGIPNFPWVLPTNDYKVAIVYCKKTDGGQFDIKDSDDKILTTIDCSGENNLGCISDYFTVGAGKAFKICPKQDNKAYVIAAMIDYQPEKKGYKIVNWSVGGRQLCDYTKDEIKTMILYDSFDTVYCELFANDSAMGKFDEYFDKLTYLIDTAKNNKKDVILNVTNRNEGYDATEDARVNFKKWENKMYEIAKKKNCCLINFDKLIGGHTVGKANGLIADTIHPNNVGHEIMAKLLNFVIFKDSNTYEVNRENTIYAIYGKRHISEEQYYNATQYFNDIKIRVWDNNGNKNSVAPVMPIIRHWVGTQGYTKFAQEGALGSTGRLLYINQNNINTQANWRLALTSPFLETVTTIPTVNDDNKNTIFRYRQEGKDDQIIVCVKVNGTEQFKSIQLVDII